MRISFVLLFIVGILQVNAIETYAQKTHLSLNYKNVELISVLDNIEQASEFYFLYNEKLLDTHRKVNINANNTLINDVLDDLFYGTNINYTIVDRKIILAPEIVAEETTIMQQNQVTGVVTGSTGEALPGVNVVVKGTTVGTMTDMDGRYSVTVPAGSTTLTFSFIGMEPQDVVIGSQTRINVTLNDAAIGLEEVVVTALGISRERKTLTYSVTEVGGESITQAKEINLGNALTGRIAGLNSSGSATGPTGSTRVIIRGNGSLNSDNQPLYIVNGVPIVVGELGRSGSRDAGDGLASINPDDIESISVLKGGTAAALYGSRAASGVILITTKSGQARQGIGVDYNTSFTFENVLVTPDWQYEYGSGARGVAPNNQTAAISFGRVSWGAKLDGSMVYNPDGEQRPYVAQKNNAKYFYNTGTNFSNTIAFSGGNETARFRFSVSNMDVKGVVPNVSANRKTFNLSTNANLSKKIIFEGRAQYNVELNKNRTAGADFTGNPNAAVGLMATNIDVRTLKPGWDKDGNETVWCDYFWVANPWFAAEKRTNEDEWNRFLGSFSLRYNLFDFLYVRARLGTDFTHIESNSISPSGAANSPIGSYSEGSRKFFENNAEILVGFDKTFGDISVNALAGGNRMYKQSRNNSWSSGNLDVPFMYFLQNGLTQTSSRTFSESAIRSLYASADFGFRNYLFLSMSGRQDWFSTMTVPTLDKSDNYLFYPSVGLSYIISETWQSRPVWLSFAKARASWAQVGGGAPNPYRTGLTYAAQTSSHLSLPLQAINGSTIASLVKPYTSTTLEGGFDVRLFNNRIGIDFTVYDRTTTNDIVDAQLPTATSWGSITLNVGKVKNQGVELMLTGSPITSRTGLNWNVILNTAYNKNEVVEISDEMGLNNLLLGTARAANGFVYHWKGQPFGMVSGNEIKRNENGQIVYNKANGIPMQTEIKPLGKGVPPLNISLTNEFSYKNFTLSFLLDSKWGGVMYNSTDSYGTYYGLHKNTVKNGVRETGVIVSGVDQDGNPYNDKIDAQSYFEGIAYTLSELFVYKADFIKLRQMNFGYTVPRTWLSNNLPFIQSANLSFVARNLFLLYSCMDNVDPESNYSTGNAQGLENFGVPPSRSYGFSLSVRF